MKYKIITVLSLSLLWMVLWGSLTLPNFVTGCVLAICLMCLFPSPPVNLNLKVRILPLIKLLFYFIFSLIQASIMVAWYALRPQKPPSAEVVQTSFKVLHSDLVQVFAIDFLILVPGSLVVDYDFSPKSLGKILVHNLDSETETEFLAQFAKVEQLLHDAFESHRPPLQQEIAPASLTDN